MTGQGKRATRVILGVESPVFDERFSFEVPGVTRDTFGDLRLELEVMDASSFLPGGASVGSFSLDLETIYRASADHELYRQWVGLDRFDDSCQVSMGATQTFGAR